MNDAAPLGGRYPHLMRATFLGREAYVVLGPYRVSVTYMRWLLGQKVSLEEALTDEQLRAQVYTDRQGVRHLNDAHRPQRPNDPLPRFLILVRSHNGTGPWKRRRVPGSEITVHEMTEEAPQHTGEFPAGTFTDEADALAI